MPCFCRALFWSLVIAISLFVGQANSSGSVNEDACQIGQQNRSSSAVETCKGIMVKIDLNAEGCSNYSQFVLDNSELNDALRTVGFYATHTSSDLNDSSIYCLQNTRFFEEYCKIEGADESCQRLVFSKFLFYYAQQLALLDKNKLACDNAGRYEMDAKFVNSTNATGLIQANVFPKACDSSSLVPNFGLAVLVLIVRLALANLTSS